MRKITSFLLLMGMAFFLIASCTKDEPEPDNNTNNEPKKATLVIAVQQANISGYIPFPKAQLFATLDDRKNNTNPISDLKEGSAEGKVTFEGLEDKVYYFNAYSNDMSMNNQTGPGTTNKLVLG